MHIWHHAHGLPQKYRFGVNFGISLSHLGLFVGYQLYPKRWKGH